MLIMDKSSEIVELGRVSEETKGQPLLPHPDGLTGEDSFKLDE